MRWFHKWRKELKTGIYWDLLQKGFVKPEDQEPETHGFEFYFDAFEELSTSRQVGFALGPIPFTAVAEYFRMYELRDFDEFAYLIRRMDNVFLELNAPKEDSGKKVEKNADAHTDKKNTRSDRHGGKSRPR